MYQQNQLPFPVNQPIHPYGNYNVIPNIGVEPRLQRFSQAIPALSQCLIQELQQNAQMNPLRTFLFNQCGVNGFQNSEFASVVMTALEYLAYLANSGGASDPNMAIRKAAQDTVSFMAALNVRKYPALSQYCDMNNVQIVLNNFDMICNQIRNSMQQPMYPGVQQQFGNPGYGGFNTFGNQSYHRASGMGGNSGLFVSATGQMPQNPNNPIVERNYYGSNNAGNTAPIQEQPPMNNVVNNPSPQKAVVDHLESKDIHCDLEEANKKWTPVNACMIRPAYEPSHQELVVSKTDAGYFYSVKEVMDESKHRLTPLFGVSKFNTQLKPAANKPQIEKAVEESKTTSGEDVTLENFSRIKLELTPVEIGYDSAWISGIIEMKRRQKEKENQDTEISIIQWSNIIATPIILSKDEAKQIRVLADMDCKKFILEISKQTVLKPSTLEIIDRILTKSINEVIKYNMSIPRLSVESFIDDFSDLINYVSNKYGDMAGAKLFNHATKLLNRKLTLVSDNEAKEITNDIYNTEDEDYDVEYFIEDISMTQLNTNSKELDIDFISDTSALLSSVSTKVWYELADTLYKEYGDIKHLIRTLDGRMLEIRKGLLVDGSYIVNLVD